jgi:protein-tyrosine phosphatase
MTPAASHLPPARGIDPPYTIAMVCLGNICRSPTAEVVLSAKLADHGLDDEVVVLSSGTGDWHVGGPMDDRASATLASAGYDPSRHRAQQFAGDWFDRADLILAMDSANLRDIGALCGGSVDADRVRRFREFDPTAAGDLDLADPYYGGLEGFRDMLAVVERTSDELIRQLVERRTSLPLDTRTRPLDTRS